MTNPRKTDNQFIRTTEEIGAFVGEKFNMENQINRTIEGMII